MELVKVEASSHQGTHDKYIVPINLLSQVIDCLTESDNDFLTSKFKQFMKYDDIRLYTLKHMRYTLYIVRISMCNCVFILSVR